MGKIEKAVEFMIEIAKDNTHGYDQIYRWGEKGDYDCSALVITAFSIAGFDVKRYGATYTGNMKKAFLKCGFKEVINKINLSSGKGLKMGDILLNEKYHTAVYIGNNKIAQASINEKGTVRNGKSGDQTGREINISPYKNYRKGWNSVLRYEEPTNFRKDNEMVEQGKFIIKEREHKIDRIIKNGTQYINLRELSNILGLKLEWDNKTKVTTIK